MFHNLQNVEIKEVKKTEKRKIIQTVLMVLTLLCSALAGYGVASWYYQASQPKHYKANVFFEYELFSGLSNLEVHNVVTDIGEEQIRGRCSSNGTFVGFFFISIGNATASTSLTELTTEYDRQLGAIVNWTYSGDSAFNCTYKWTFTETVNLSCTGSHWASSGDNNMGACANFPEAQTFNANENLTVRWVWIFNAN